MSAASNCGFESCTFIPLFHLSCFKLEYFYVFFSCSSNLALRSVR